MKEEPTCDKHFDGLLPEGIFLTAVVIVCQKCVSNVVKCPF